MKTEVIQDCGCVINLYSDDSAGGAEIGEYCPLHGAAEDLLQVAQLLTLAPLQHGARIPDELMRMAQAAIARAGRGQ